MGSRTAAVGLLVAVVLVACNDKALEVTRSAEGGAPTLSLAPEQAAKVLAKVGGHTITLGDYVASLEHMDQFDRLRYQSPERRKELLNEMIDLELLANEAKKNGYDQDPVAQQAVRGILRDALLAQARKGSPGPNDIPEAEVHAYYDAHLDAYKDPERRRVSVIVLANSVAADQALDAAKKTTTATQWGELVRTRSLDPQAKANVPVDLAGDLGMVGPPGDARGDNARVPDEVRAALFEIPKVNDILGHLVKGGDGRFYVVRLTQKTDAHERSFAEADRAIRVLLVQERLRGRENELLASLRAQYPVEVDEAVLASVEVNLGDGGLEGGLPAAPSAIDAGGLRPRGRH